ncbi:MAG: tetratricopeptide repeat protein [Candidatus Krumholzibacteriia bacterium]
MLCVVLSLAMTGGIERKAATRNRDATEAFEAQRFEEAVDLYNQALTHAPESEGISYNLGNALYRQQKLEDAAAALGRATQSADPDLRHHSLYNLGNTFFQMGNAAEAVTAYRRALDAKPDDLDTKINLEKALRLLQQQEQQQQEQQQNPDGDSEQQDQQQQSQGGGSNQEQQQSGDQEQQGQDSQDQDSQDSAGDEEQQQPQDEEPLRAGIDSLSVDEGELRPEEALRILEAMRDQEKELQKERARKARARARRVEKDW